MDMRLLALGIFFSLTALGQTKMPVKKEPAGEETFTEGVKLFVLEDFKGALTQFETFVKLEDKSAAGYYMKSRTERALDQNLKAELSAQTAVNLDKNTVYYLLNYADVLAKNNKNKEAQEVYKNIIKLDNANVKHYFSLYQLQIDAAQWAEALKTLEITEKQFGASEEITKAKQVILLRENKVDAALKEGNKMVSQNPEFVLNQAKVLVSNKREKEAAKLLQTSVAENPEFMDGIGMLSELYAVLGEEKASEELLNTVLAKNALPYSVKVNAIGNHLKIVQNKKPEVSILLDKTKELIKQHPNESRAYVYLGDLNFKLGQPVEARNAYNEYLKRDRSKFEVWLALLELDYALADFKSLAKNGDDASMYFPNQGLIWFYLSLGQLGNGNSDDAEISIEEAERLLQAADFKAGVEAVKAAQQLKSGKSGDVLSGLLQKNPNNEFVQYLTAESLLKAQANKAVELSKKLTDNFPQKNIYKLLYASSLTSSGKAIQALEVLNKIAPNEWVSSNYFEVAGDAHLALNQKDKAKESWDKALEFNKSNKSVLNKIKQL